MELLQKGRAIEGRGQWVKCFYSSTTVPTSMNFKALQQRVKGVTR